MPFSAGDTLTVREVWAGQVWLEFPELVVAAAEITDLLDGDDRWWAPWDGWTTPVED